MSTRSKAFSGKQKKTQLQEKRLKKKEKQLQNEQVEERFWKNKERILTGKGEKEVN